MSEENGEISTERQVVEDESDELEAPSYRELQISKIRMRKDVITDFGVDDYMKSPELTLQLMQERHMKEVKCMNLEDHLEELKKELSNWKLRHANLQSKKDSVDQIGWVILVITFVAAVLVGLGVNVATSLDNTGLGVVLIIIALVLEIAAFISKKMKVW